MPNIRGKQICWWPDPFLDSEIVWSTCRPHWTKHNRQCRETREGRVRWAAQSSENCWHRRWQLVKVLHHLVRTLYTLWGPMWRLLLWAQTEARLGRTVLPPYRMWHWLWSAWPAWQQSVLVCGVWCWSQAAAIHFFIVRAGRVFALNWSDECAGDVMWVLNRALQFWHRCSIGGTAYTESGY